MKPNYIQEVRRAVVTDMGKRRQSGNWRAGRLDAATWLRVSSTKQCVNGSSGTLCDCPIIAEVAWLAKNPDKATSKLHGADRIAANLTKCSLNIRRSALKYCSRNIIGSIFVKITVNIRIIEK